MTTSITGRSTIDDDPHDADRASTGRLGDRIFGGLATGSGLLVVAIVTLVGVFLLVQAVPSLMNNDANFLLSREWSPSGANPRFGIADLAWGTLVTSVIAMLIAVPLGVAVALFITQYAPRWLSRPAAATVDLLAAVPSIVYGFWGLNIAGQYFEPVASVIQGALGWIPFLSDQNVSAKSTLAFAGVILAIMILPIVTAISREVFAQVPTTHKEGALALGATKWEMIRVAVLPYGKPGIISAAMLGLGRALGETLAVLILLSTLSPTKEWSFSIFNGGSTFASKIAGGASEFDTPQKTGAYIAAGLVLFVVTFLVNAAARIVIERRKAFSE
ncbi:phosphate ABC transporter permease subunit PstC [Phycicoccus sp. MAQZ13P-2]|uniref:phosphate ABC transporter permease subunit PstC n=1 Tax=Phycicoccus mangrovi TaxID=2840470 RepID=UPI001C007C9C|nr:phosphate ABC transporter permease subunit PstC [Phycicoccus mangrovi]MBT9256129.1 phosphate ABC transporter permease subunit PstC [Phycicoccus mangrovi]MBT9273856.1 phosphate ABC transporter permease subunit PstC [Phycicoccus mangrovi]